jgi:DNA polymerase I-like protein with 3'-5' exonuclease and polymerase domains
MNILTIDFETYYSQDFSLTKMTTEEYIRSPEFEVIGVSVQVDDAEPVWFSGDMPSTEDWLRQFDWERSFALAHNAIFDGAILSWLFDIKPKGWLDTLSMGRALHGSEVGGSLAVLAQHYGLGEKGTEVVNAKGLRRADFPTDQLARYGEYCKNDVALTYKLFNCMGQDFPLSELKLIDLTIRMFSEPVLRIDTKVLNERLAEVREKKQALLDAVTMVDKDQLMSNHKLAATLKLMGVQPPTKISPTTGKETYAFSKTDEEFRALLEHEDERVQAIVAARLGVKSTLEETRIQRFIDIAERGTLPVPLRYYAAHTGRWGGDDKLNLQNLPRGSKMKNAICAPAGHVFIDSDSSQIEARTLAWLAEQDDLVKAFEAGEDVYKIMASAIYRKPVADIDKNERFIGKTTILGSGYGMGASKFQAQLKTSKVDITEKEAEHIINTYRDTYPKIAKFWRAAGKALDAILQNQHTELGRGGLLKVEGKKGILLPNGLYLRYPNLRKMQDDDGNPQYVYDSKKGKQVIATKIYGGKVTENVCQALARIVIGEQMLRVAKKYKVVMTVHDAIACIAPKAEADNAKEYVELCMRIRPSWAPDLPLNCEAGCGASYGDC